MKNNNALKLVICIVVSEMAGIIGAIFTTPSITTWYSTLVKPALNPPSWVFGPVWTTLFLMMGISMWLVWREMDSRLRGNDMQDGNPSNQTVRADDKKIKKIVFFVFGIQLVLNTFWSVIFFGMHQPGAAFVEIIFLVIAIIATIFVFYKISKLAAWLLAPYIIWVCFAGYLNFSLWNLNPSTSSGQVQQIACTMEAKLCPDGSAVGRAGPNCEFAACPDSNIKYQNDQYGFNFILPASWKGYSITVGNWEGRNQENVISENGPEIFIRHPQWTSENQRQDIPIMIFTINQWDLLQRDKFHIGAAPINPSELGRNNRFVFALPARYNYAFPTGYEEVDQILQSNLLQVF